MVEGRRGKVTPLSGLLVAVSLGIAGVPSGPGGTELPAAEQEISLVGRMAPDFELASVNRKPVRLSNLRGRAVLLNFWATWCAACRVETPWLVELYGRHRRRDLEIVGVSMDDAGEAGIAQFVRANRVAYPILLGGKSIAGDYGGIRLLPQTFLIDRQGRVVESLIGVANRDALEKRVRRLLSQH